MALGIILSIVILMVAMLICYFYLNMASPAKPYTPIVPPKHVAPTKTFNSSNSDFIPNNTTTGLIVGSMIGVSVGSYYDESNNSSDDGCGPNCSCGAD